MPPFIFLPLVFPIHFTEWKSLCGYCSSTPSSPFLIMSNSIQNSESQIFLTAIDYKFLDWGIFSFILWHHWIHLLNWVASYWRISAVFMILKHLNYKILGNIVDSVVNAYSSCALGDCELYFFKDNFAARCTYYKRGSNMNKDFNKLIFKL